MKLEDFLPENSETVQDVKLDLEQVKTNMPSYSNEKICEMIVCDRYFGFNQTISKICMEELSNRRVAGDNFNFEEYIEAAYKSLPELNFSIPNITGEITKAIMGKFKV